MTEVVSLGFHMGGQILPISSILPTRRINVDQKKGSKYAAVLASIQEVGIIEPPVVFPMTGTNGSQYLLLDGHLRIEALKDLGGQNAFCLISRDDEGYTYNHKVNRLVPIQEHFMIIRALERGVSEERIAKALRLDVHSIRMKRNMLNGICPEAVERRSRILLIQQPHHRQRVGVRRRRLIVPAGARQPEQGALPGEADLRVGRLNQRPLGLRALSRIFF